MMACYTVVHEGYDVQVYRTLKGVSESMAREGLCLSNEGESDPEPATAKDIAAALRKGGLVRLYPVDGGDWSYRIEKQERIL